MKKFFCLLMLMVLIGLGYYYWTTTQPIYSLNKVITSVVNKDWTSFQKYVDVDGVGKKFVDQMINGKFQTGAKQEQITMFSEAISSFAIPQIKDQIRNQIESTDDSKNMPCLLDIDVKTTKIVSVRQVEKQGKIAIVILNLQSDNVGDFPLKIKMRDKDGYWQVSEILNLEELLLKAAKTKEQKMILRQARYKLQMKDSAGNEYNVYIFSNDERSTNKSSWFPGHHRVFEGEYSAAISQTGNDLVTVQAVKLFSNFKEETMRGTFDLDDETKKNSAYVVSSTFEGQPDILVVSQRQAATTGWLKAFMIDDGVLYPIAFGSSKMAASNTPLRCVAPMLFHSSAFSNARSETEDFRGVFYYAWKLNPSIRTFDKVDQRFVSYKQPKLDW